MDRPGLVLLVAALAVALAEGATPEGQKVRLGELELSQVLVAGNGRAEVVTYHRATKEIQLWSGEGVLRSHQRLADPRLDGEAHQLAAGGD